MLNFLVHPIRMGEFKVVFIMILGLFCLNKAPLFAQDTPEKTYQMPPKVLADLVDAPSAPSVDIDPTNIWMLILERPSLPSISELAQPELRIAGLRINPKTNGPSRSRYFSALKLKKISGGEEVPITGLPENARIRHVEWSPDGKHIAFLVVQENGQSLWVANAASRKAWKLISTGVNSAYRTPFHWVSDNKTLICRIVPDDRGEPPVAPTVPLGPIMQETTGRKAAARTYQDLLKDAHDEALFEYYLNAQAVQVNLDGKTTPLGSSGLIKRAEPSPDGKYILVETLHRPLSYLVPVRRFPYQVEIWDMKGNVVKQIADLPLAEEVPIGRNAVPTGPRSFDWRSDTHATLYWVEAQDGGNPKQEAEVRDIVYTLKAPFLAAPQKLVSLQLRYAGIDWGTGDLALSYEWWWQNRRTRTWRIKPDASTEKPDLLFDYSYQDRYNDPGEPLSQTNSRGYSVLVTNGKVLYLIGDGASPEGDRPFLDEFNFATKKTKRLWRSEAPFYERVVNFIDAKKQKVLTRRESKTEPPNYFVRNLQKNKLEQITDFPHPTPQFANVQKEQIRYDREDGVKLTATLYLPSAYKAEDGPLPMLMWAYPREFKSAAAAAQVTSSPHRFDQITGWSRVIWTALGYAVLDAATMPIIGEGDEEPNDTYVTQLVASAKAAIDEMVRRGVADRNRIAIGGHSYGAFMTANLLAHSDLFAAGIARSGAYNRSLTPFGFQSEQRTFWEAPEVYFKMSPFMHADKVNEPILLIHGKVDNNSGTFPMQSERFFNAVKGHGGKARLVMLPHESHGYRARESIMHMLWEMSNWLEKYVKNVPGKMETSMK